MYSLASGVGTLFNVRNLSYGTQDPLTSEGPGPAACVWERFAVGAARGAVVGERRWGWVG